MSLDRIRRRVLGVAAVLIVCANALTAQTAPARPPTGFDPLRQPGTPLDCRYVSPPTDAPPSAIAIQFEDGALLQDTTGTEGREMSDDREITAIYDSTGAPFGLQIITSELRDGMQFAHGIVVSYPTAQSERGLEFIIPANRSLNMQVPVDLPAEQLQRARALSIWLWSHRCQRGIAM